MNVTLALMVGYLNDVPGQRLQMRSFWASGEASKQSTGRIGRQMQRAVSRCQRCWPPDGSSSYLQIDVNQSNKYMIHAYTLLDFNDEVAIPEMISSVQYLNSGIRCWCSSAVAVKQHSLNEAEASHQLRSGAEEDSVPC